MKSYALHEITETGYYWYGYHRLVGNPISWFQIVLVTIDEPKGYYLNGNFHRGLDSDPDCRLSFHGPIPKPEV